jgi:hypothetical protein
MVLHIVYFIRGNYEWTMIDRRRQIRRERHMYFERPQRRPLRFHVPSIIRTCSSPSSLAFKSPLTNHHLILGALFILSYSLSTQINADLSATMFYLLVQLHWVI